MTGATLLTGACGGSALLTGVSLSTSTLEADGRSGAVSIAYTLSGDASVSIFLEDSAGNRYTLRDKQTRGAGSYTFQFNGATETKPGQSEEKRVLPNGSYVAIVQAVDASQRSEESRASLEVVNADTNPPAITHLLAYPEQISPNYDGIDDAAQITYGLTKQATVDVFVTAPDGGRIPLQVTQTEEPGEYQVAFEGKDATQGVLPDGTYTYTVLATDTAGNRTAGSGNVTVADSGVPHATITAIDFSPTRLAQGETMKVTVRVKNTGSVTIHSLGADPGFTYNTNDTYTSVSDGRYNDQAGMWALGVDWERRFGGGERYPLRWSFGKDLAPGEEVTVVGYVTVLENEPQLWFYAGLIQEEISYPSAHLGRTLITVGQ
jgi:hypothetical protein